MKNSPIKIIDLFAGPGGLGEGFSSFNEGGKYPFRISLSVEMEHSAWKTLRLRSFVRQFTQNNKPIPNEYFTYLAGNLGTNPEEILFKKFEKQASAANEEALQLKLGDDHDNQVIFDKIKSRLGNDKNWVLIGGPPCQAFSLMGRARNKGKENYVPEEDHRHFLYQEYLKIIEEFSPAVFVMENVKGILSSKINGELIFNKIKEDLENPSKALNKPAGATYRIFSLVSNNHKSSQDPHDFIIKSEDYGIPQARHRVILLGVRNDISNIPKKLNKKKKPP
jgi:DNA (cytosine-5)-methyltransferase 1